MPNTCRGSGTAGPSNAASNGAGSPIAPAAHARSSSQHPMTSLGSDGRRPSLRSSTSIAPSPTRRWARPAMLAGRGRWSVIAWSPLDQLGERVEVVEVAEIEHLEVGALDPLGGERRQLLRRLLHGAGDAVVAQLVGLAPDRRCPLLERGLV